MATITFITTRGDRLRVQATVGQTLMQAAVAADVPGIDGDCGGSCNCATCHVIVQDAWADRVGPAQGAEQEILEFSSHGTPTSRLACQIQVTDALEGLEVTVCER